MLNLQHKHIQTFEEFERLVGKEEVGNKVGIRLEYYLPHTKFYYRFFINQYIFQVKPINNH